MIGFYDSGIGGVTIFEEVQKILPHVAKVYLGDTKNCPLGDKTDTEILEATKAGCDFLFSHGCSLVVIACNTATTIAIRPIQNNWLPKSYPTKKVLGIIRPVSEELIENEVSKEINIAILATKATINSKFYEEELKQAGYKNLFPIICTGLASSIEEQSTTKIDEDLELICRQNLLSISKLDYAILACTHYPLAQNQILQKLHKYGAKKEIQLVSQAKLVSLRLSNYLQRHPEIQIQNGENQFFVTSKPKEFQAKIKTIFGIQTDVKLV
jgi:glutamate racemase